MILTCMTTAFRTTLVSHSLISCTSWQYYCSNYDSSLSDMKLNSCNCAISGGLLGVNYLPWFFYYWWKLRIKNWLQSIKWLEMVCTIQTMAH